MASIDCFGWDPNEILDFGDEPVQDVVSRPTYIHVDTQHSFSVSVKYE